MKALDFTSIILGILTFVNGFGWFFDRKKHKEEVQGMKADNNQNKALAPMALRVKRT